MRPPPPQQGTGSELPPALTPGDPLFGLGYAPPVLSRPFTQIGGGEVREGEAAVAEEVPVAFVYNGRPHVVMMATPADLEDFAVGFTLDEGIVRSPTEIASVNVVRFSEGIELQMDVPGEAAERLAARGRQFVGRTGCGLCGVETIREALRPVPRTGNSEPIAAESLWHAEAALVAHQEMNRKTGSMHAAAWATRSGEIAVLREDVGRHNALDKVLGALARAGRDPAEGFIVMTSRASYELVQKAASFGVPLLAAVSRPTGLAIRLAESAGMTLVGLLRGRTAMVYAGGSRLRADP